jgi:hypothetical protein
MSERALARKVHCLPSAGGLWGILFFCSPAVFAVDMDPGTIIKPATSPAAPDAELLIQPYEPLTGGYTYDSDDAPYLDVNLSIKFRLLPIRYLSAFGGENRLYFTMVTRFGFYWGTRPSSPVIGKRFNPQLLWRYTPNPGSGTTTQFNTYIDVGYAHESNGQLVHTPEQYNDQLRLTPSFQEADQYIHRGWDYLHVVWKPYDIGPASIYLEGKYFFANGLLQGPEDEYHSWENNSQGKQRKAVDGLDVAFDYPSANVLHPVAPDRLFGTFSLSGKYQTGYDTPFRYSTERLELGFQLGSLPIAVWVQHGYMSSLAMYYLNVTSVGVEVRFASFG